MNDRDAYDSRAVSRVLILAPASALRAALKDRLREAASRATDNFTGDFIDPDDGMIEDRDALDEAVARWRRGEKREALHHLENAPGRDFAGLGDLKPEGLHFLMSRNRIGWLTTQNPIIDCHALFLALG